MVKMVKTVVQGAPKVSPMEGKTQRIIPAEPETNAGVANKPLKIRGTGAATKGILARGPMA